MGNHRDCHRALCSGSFFGSKEHPGCIWDCHSQTVPDVCIVVECHRSHEDGNHTWIWTNITKSHKSSWLMENIEKSTAASKMPCHNLSVEQPSHLPRLDPKIRLSSLWHLRRFDAEIDRETNAHTPTHTRERTHWYTQVCTHRHIHTRLMLLTITCRSPLFSSFL